MPEREDFDALRVAHDTIVEMVINARKVNATNGGQRHVCRAGADFTME